MTTDALPQIAALMREAQRILFITGAGMSADSGLPTYRGIGGLYQQGLTEDGMSIETAISGAMLEVRPEITWKYLMQIERACHQAGFNRGHQVLAQIEQLKPETWVLTQNIDGFHRAAGSRNVIEIHGRFSELYCTQCAYQRKQVTDYSQLPSIPPRCPQCGGLVRPAVVLFGELLPDRAVAQLYQQLNQGFSLIFSIGTTSQFPYIMKPVHMAERMGAVTVEINPGHTQVSDLVDYKISAGAAETLTRLWELMQA